MKPSYTSVVIVMAMAISYCSNSGNNSSSSSSGYPVLERISRNAADAQGNGISKISDINDSGRLAVFSSFATNLLTTTDSNSLGDIFLRDRDNNTVTRLSVSSISDAEATGGHSTNPAISSDGQYIVFESAATNLVSGDTNGVTDIFLRDRTLKTTTRVSTHSNGTEANAASSLPQISNDGKFIVFKSAATNMITGGTTASRTHIYLHDRVNGTTELLTVAPDGTTEADGNSDSPDINADGTFVTFSSSATNLIASDTNAQIDVFVRDISGTATERVSVATGGTESTGGFSNWPSISGDGQYIAFGSMATNLVASDSNGITDIFLHDRVGNTTIRVSKTPIGGDLPTGSYYPSISLDGRYIAFESPANELSADDNNSCSDIYVYDRQDDINKRISLKADGTEVVDEYSYLPKISGNGMYVIFESDSTELVTGDTNGVRDVFVHDN